MFEQLDLLLLDALNGFAGRSFTFDRGVLALTTNSLFKTVPFAAAYVWLWFTERGVAFPAAPLRRNTRFLVLSGLAAAVLAAGFSRLVQNVMWERPRPLHDPMQEVIRPLGLAEDFLADYSSFPSDNAALTFALATGLFLISRRIGAAAFAWALMVACLPRVFAGFHYPSDIVGGALIGVLTALCLVRFEALGRLHARLTGLHDRYPGFLYASGFVVVYQIATFFGDLRSMGKDFRIILDLVL